MRTMEAIKINKRAMICKCYISDLLYSYFFISFYNRIRIERARVRGSNNDGRDSRFLMVKDAAARIELGSSFHQEGTFNLKVCLRCIHILGPPECLYTVCMIIKLCTEFGSICLCTSSHVKHFSQAFVLQEAGR